MPGLDDSHLHAFFRALDADCSGTLSLKDLVDGVFGKLPERQLMLVRLAFAVRLSSLCAHAAVAPLARH